MTRQYYKMLINIPQRRNHVRQTFGDKENIVLRAFSGGFHSPLPFALGCSAH